jgi:hypothetical protein
MYIWQDHTIVLILTNNVVMILFMHWLTSILMIILFIIIEMVSIGMFAIIDG